VVALGQFQPYLETVGPGISITGIERIWAVDDGELSDITFELLRSSSSNEYEPPIINRVDLHNNGNTVTFTIDASDDSGIARIVILNIHDGIISSSEPDLPLPPTGPYEIGVDICGEDDRYVINVIDEHGNIATYSGKAGNMYAIDVDAGPDRTVMHHNPVSFETQIANFERLVPPVTIIWEFGDSESITRQLTPAELEDGRFTEIHTYTDEALSETIATVRVFDFDGGEGFDEVSVTFSYSELLENAITCKGDVTINSNSYVAGPVLYGGQLINEGTIDGNVTKDEYMPWPDSAYFVDFYIRQVDIQNPDDRSLIDIAELEGNELESLYRNGDLNIDNTGEPADITLEGTIYVTGNLDFQQPGGKRSYSIDLNGQTVFVEGDITFPAHRVSLSGSGCIIALGNINFQPVIESSIQPAFAALISLEGEITLHPQGILYGTVVGQNVVTLQPDCYIEHTDPIGLNFPQ